MGTELPLVFQVVGQSPDFFPNDYLLHPLNDAFSIVTVPLYFSIVAQYLNQCLYYIFSVDGALTTPL